MDKIKNKVENINVMLHKNILFIILILYFVGLVFPDYGLLIRNICVGKLLWIDKSTFTLSLPVLLISFLLFNAGLGIKISEFRNLVKHPLGLFMGLICNLFVPLIFILFTWMIMKLWHNQDEVQNILVGLAILASMPIASSSTAWSQNVDGNLALSLGLVIFSTLLSPITTPFILHSVGFLTYGDYGQDLHELASGGTGAFIAYSIIAPSVLGILFHFLIGESRIKKIKPYLKLINMTCLTLLIYSNAAISLPQAFIKPDWDFLLVSFMITLCLCAIAFLSGFLISKIIRSGKPEQASLMFALGMNNNGAALVLASIALPDHIRILLPIIFYNFIQQVVASIISSKMS